LRQSAYRGASERQLRELGESLVNAAIYMTVLMQPGEQLISDAGEQVSGRVGFVFRVICLNCDDDPPATPVTRIRVGTRHTIPSAGGRLSE
jgi:hypothetical protein